jgi:hypothetical protein
MPVGKGSLGGGSSVGKGTDTMNSFFATTSTRGRLPSPAFAEVGFDAEKGQASAAFRAPRARWDDQLTVF